MKEDTRSVLSVQMCQGLILACMAGYSQHPRTPTSAFRKFDGMTPAVFHAIWCATTIVNEPALSEEDRRLGFQVLLFHDFKKDTTADFPVALPQEARTYVEVLTFSSLVTEMRVIWRLAPRCRLFMLYAKAANLWDDASWMSDEEHAKYLGYVLSLADTVEFEQGEIGSKLTIIQVVRELCRRRAR